MNAIVAICRDWGIGNQGKLLVRNRADMRHFVDLTLGGTVIMGRATLDSFPGGRPLKDRRNIVLTRQEDFVRDGVEVAHDVDEALALVAGEPQDKVWVIGGQSVYEQLLPLCTRVELTRNDCVRDADAFFPNLDLDRDWHIAREEDQGETTEGIPFAFVTYQRAQKEEDSCR